MLRRVSGIQSLRVAAGGCWSLAAVAAGGQLRRALAAPASAGAAGRPEADAALRRIEEDCAACHKRHRN